MWVFPIESNLLFAFSLAVVGTSCSRYLDAFSNDTETIHSKKRYRRLVDKVERNKV